MLYHTREAAAMPLSLETPSTWGALQFADIGGEQLYRRIMHHKRCRQCRKPAGHWTGKRVCGCGNPHINKGSSDGFGSLGEKVRHIAKYR